MALIDSRGIFYIGNSDDPNVLLLEPAGLHGSCRTEDGNSEWNYNSTLASGSRWVLKRSEEVTINTVAGQTPFTNPPAAPAEGDVFINTESKTEWIYDGNTWQPYHKIFTISDKSTGLYTEKTVDIKSDLYNTSDAYNFLFGADNYLLNSSIATNSSLFSRQFGFYNKKSTFWAGRVNAVDSNPSTTVQWEPDRLSQYTFLSGWNQWSYGGEVQDGSRAKGQTLQGYNNRGAAFGAQTHGVNNINTSIEGSISGSENTNGKKRFDFINYNSTNFTLEISGDVTTAFVANDYVAIRVYDNANFYWTVGHAKVISSSFNTPNTLITLDRGGTMGTDVLFTSGYIINFNPDRNAGGENSHIIGTNNHLESERTVALGNNHINYIAHGSTHIGSNTLSTIRNSVNIGGAKFANAGDAQVMIVPMISALSKIPGLDIYTISPDGLNERLNMPENTTWKLKGEFVMRSINDGALIKNGGFSFDMITFRNGTGVAQELSQNVVYNVGTPVNWTATVYVSLNRVNVQINIPAGEEARCVGSVTISQVSE